MSNLTLIQFQYEPLAVPLGALYLSYGLEKANIQFDLKICHLYKMLDKKQGVSFKIDKLHSFLANSREIIAVGCWPDMLPFLLVALKKDYKNIIIPRKEARLRNR